MDPLTDSSLSLANLDITVLSSEDVLRDTTTSSQIIDLINSCFGAHPNFDTTSRFVDVNDFAKTIGEDGFCVAVWAGLGESRRPVGSASIKLFTPRRHLLNYLQKEMPDFANLDESYLDYEPFAVVSRNNPECRGKGFASRCTTILEQRLQGVAQHQVPTNAQKTKARLWVQVAENPNGPYWRRRGYVSVGPSETKPVGWWGARKEFEFTTMVKII